MSSRIKPKLRVDSTLSKSPRSTPPLTPTRKPILQKLVPTIEKKPSKAIQNTSISFKSIVDCFLNTRYQKPHFEITNDSNETQMVNRINRVLGQSPKILNVSEYSSVQKETIQKILKIVEEETEKNDQKFLRLCQENANLKSKLSKINFDKVQKGENSAEYVINLCRIRGKTGENKEKIKKLKALIENSVLYAEKYITEIIDGEEETLIGDICEELCISRACFIEKQKNLTSLIESNKIKKLSLEAEISEKEESVKNPKRLIDLLELAETWTDASYTEDHSKKEINI